MIPKIIHYCWFGGNPLHDLAKKCIASWKKHCPDYKLMVWNEDNFDINTVSFTAQVAKAKKWGFIVDYIRAYAIYNHGGIYLDIDVEIIKPFSASMLKNTCFGGFEDEKNINPGNIFAGEKGCYIAKEVMDFYALYNFLNKDGSLNLTASPKIFTEILIKYGLKQDNSYQELGIFTSYPTEYFCPMSYKTGMIDITKNTYSIHHYDGSWLSEEQLLYNKLRYKTYARLGDNMFSRFVVLCLMLITRIKLNGIFNTAKYCIKKILG